jgi:hypothetical protein
MSTRILGVILVALSTVIMTVISLAISRACGAEPPNGENRDVPSDANGESSLSERRVWPRLRC